MICAPETLLGQPNEFASNVFDTIGSIVLWCDFFNKINKNRIETKYEYQSYKLKYDIFKM